MKVKITKFNCRKERLSTALTVEEEKMSKALNLDDFIGELFYFTLVSKLFQA